MDFRILSGLIHNTALLLSMCLVYDTLVLNKDAKRSARKVLTGLLLGGIGIAVMFSHWQWYSGVIFDTRSLLLCTSGLFFGTVPTVIAMGMTGAYRLYLGGNGALMGVSVILASGLIGILWRKKRDNPADISFVELYLFGAVVHLVMLFLMFLLPGSMIADTMTRIGLPVMLIFPAGTALLGKLMASRYQHIRAEEALRESEYRYRTLFELESDATFLIDNEQGDIIEVNATASNLYGYSRDELVGLRNVDLSAEPDQTRKATKSDRTVIPLRWHRKKDGTVFPVEIKATHLSWKGRPVHIASIRDISERIRNEEERKTLESQLLQSQKIEAVGQLAGGIAHDFNNILTVIFGYSDMLSRNIEPGNPLRPCVENIVSSAARAAELTRGLLAFSRKQLLDSRPVSIEEVVTDIQKILARVIREDIDFRTEFPDEILTVHADKGQMGQVLINLVTNAVDAMPDGGTLTIRVHPCFMDAGFIEKKGFGKPGDYARISVTDTGGGIESTILEKIFEPFFTTKETGKGTGLGLSIVYGIVKQHNGYIDVESEKGVGTTFFLYLPLIERGGTGIPTEAPRDCTGISGRETILLAEDDDIVREMDEITLSDAGYRVISARDGEDAVAKYRHYGCGIDLLIFDVVMPNKDGKTAYEEIKRLRPDMKALFMSGYTSDIVVRKGIPEDEDFFLVKPFKPYHLLKKTREILDR